MCKISLLLFPDLVPPAPGQVTSLRRTAPGTRTACTSTFSARIWSSKTLYRWSTGTWWGLDIYITWFHINHYVKREEHLLASDRDSSWNRLLSFFPEKNLLASDINLKLRYLFERLCVKIYDMCLCRWSQCFQTEKTHARRFGHCYGWLQNWSNG